MIVGQKIKMAIGDFNEKGDIQEKVALDPRLQQINSEPECHWVEVDSWGKVNECRSCLKTIEKKLLIYNMADTKVVTLTYVYTESEALDLKRSTARSFE